MLIDWIILHLLPIFWYIVGIFILAKAVTVFFMIGTGGYFWILLSTFAVINKHDIKNTFDEKLKRYLIISNWINIIFYWLAGAVLFLYFFTLLLIN